MAVNVSIEVMYTLEEAINLPDVFITQEMEISITPSSLKVRTDFAERTGSGSSIRLSGAVIDIGPFQSYQEKGNIYGYFQYKPSYINNFNQIDVFETELTKLSTTDNNSWNVSADNIDNKKDYQYRACIRVVTESCSYHFHGRTYTTFKNGTLALSGLELSETFVDARDLTTEAGLVNRGLEKLFGEKVESWNEREFKHWVWNKLKNIINTVDFGSEYLNYNTMTDDEISSLLAAFSSSDVLNFSDLDRIELIIQLNNEVNELTQEKVDQFTDSELKLLVRLLIGDTRGVYRDYTTSELKCLLEAVLFDTINFEDFLAAFPFDKWDRITKQKLNLTVTNNSTIKVEYLESGPYQYLRDFNVGDVIAVEYPGIFTAVSRVVEVEEIYTESGNEYKITLGRETKKATGKLKDGNNVGNRL